MTQLEHKVVALVVSAYTCGIIALFSRFLSVYTMVLVTRNFGRGLKSRSKCMIFREQETYTLLQFSKPQHLEQRRKTIADMSQLLKILALYYDRLISSWTRSTTF